MTNSNVVKRTINTNCISRIAILHYMKQIAYAIIPTDESEFIAALDVTFRPRKIVCNNIIMLSDCTCECVLLNVDWHFAFCTITTHVESH